MQTDHAFSSYQPVATQDADHHTEHLQLKRGKFRSLTLINWNGFFARTFDLDDLVTTLSGGNGAGKSTTMAGFVTALIPDLTLLHFRNTTEAGATTGNRDRGLHGKLRPGACYALLDVINSRQQRIIVGVRLQQIAGRDRKVDIKSFSIQNVPLFIEPISLVTEPQNERKVRVLSLNELKEKMEQSDTQFKQYHSITDYHAMMFELGVIPRRLRSVADRSKFYKLIEASLYGGISSAITRSLRDYLLPENLGVRKAFQDMESALRENRMTLEAIKVTQADRDLFKHLIHEATEYVATDYMRHANQRKSQITQALEQRRALYQNKMQLEINQQKIIELSKDLAQLKAKEEQLDVDYQGATQHLTLVTNAIHHQEKIHRYQDEVIELQEKFEEQKIVLEEAQEQFTLAQDKVDQSEEMVEDLRNQLADYQQALDAQQTRALQYQQAVQSFEIAKEVCELSELNNKNIVQFHQEVSQQLATYTNKLLDLEQKLLLSNGAKEQFDRAFQLLEHIAGETPRHQAWQIAKTRLNEYPQQKLIALQADKLNAQLADLEKQRINQQKVRLVLDEFNQQVGMNLTNAEDLQDYFALQESKQEEISLQLSQCVEQRSTLIQQRDFLSNKQQELRQKAPIWLNSQHALQRLQEQTGQPLTSRQEITDFMQQLLHKERKLTIERDQLATQKQALEYQIRQLSLPDGAEDPRLSRLAESFSGVLLSELYDDVPIEDAPYFSALYGPARHAIVVRDIEAVKQKLAELEDCPDDLYLIEGDPSAFDDNVFQAEELAKGVLVQVSQRELRYSTFPDTPVFGRAARETQLEKLQQQQEEVAEQYADIAFDVQKCQRLHQQVSDFVGQHLAIAFQDDPERTLAETEAQFIEIEEQFADITEQQQQLQQTNQHIKQQLNQLNRLIPQLNLLEDVNLTTRLESLQEQLDLAKKEALYVRQYGHFIEQLEPIVHFLQNDPENHQQLKQAVEQCSLQQKSLKQKQFMLADAINRIPHLAYESMLNTDNHSLTKELRQRLAQQQQERDNQRSQVEDLRQRLAQYQQVYTALQTTLQVKQETLNELVHEIAQQGIRADEGAIERATVQRDELQQQLNYVRQQYAYADKQITLIESELDNLNRQIRKLEREYSEQRSLVVATKVSWCIVQRLSRDNNVEKRLHRREYAYLTTEQLRSMSDKALGALRTAVHENEYLRDSLRLSEDTAKPENKVRFFIAVYQHLRERIRQDILQTDDPIDAIEQMEIELARLTDELTQREHKLAINSESVANIMRKTILREQNRIRLLNQGLQNITFGQVKSVRLVVNIRDSHAMLLDALSNKNEDYQDFFKEQKLSFSEALAKLYQRLNPHIDMGQRTHQTIGEELLDYRNYLDLEVEVYRGTDGWLKAESGALSTGEAIGTGMSILLMVVQSWEEESRRIRGKDIIPCRLLFLDEAARLDAKSISTLFELCHRLDMQLLIAAPENISPEQGTTYKLVRKIFNNQEHVHVVGLRGFGSVSSNA